MVLYDGVWSVKVSGTGWCLGVVGVGGQWWVIGGWC